MSERERVAAHWGDAAFTADLARLHWMGSWVVCGYLNHLATGDPREDWLRRARRRWLAPRARRRGPLRVLVLGCGDGWIERAMAGWPEVGAIDACDVAAGAVERAAAAAAAAGIAGRVRYHVTDLDAEPPPGGPYDVAVAHAVLHHVRELERAFPALAASLAPGGLLLFNEYVGPCRFQFPPRQVAAIGRLLACLPASHRRSALTGATWEAKPAPDAAEVAAADPSEAVRSDELRSFLHRHFDVVEETAGGGTLLQHLLYDLVPNFDPASLDDCRLLALLCLAEGAVIHRGILPADYVVATARRRPDGAPPRPPAEPPAPRCRAPRAVPVREVLAPGAPPGPRLRLLGGAAGPRGGVADRRLARELLEVLQPAGAPPPGRAERLGGWLADRWAALRPAAGGPGIAAPVMAAAAAAIDLGAPARRAAADLVAACEALLGEEGG